MEKKKDEKDRQELYKYICWVYVYYIIKKFFFQ